jgi:UDP-glucose:(heptosyl)LPS alpha-1,3-glucosyltransferase
MRVTICCKQFAESGGAEVIVIGLARHLAARAHQVRVLALRGGARVDGVQVAPLSVPSRPRALSDLLLARAARKALAAEDADVTFSDQRCWGADVVRPGGGVQLEYIRQRQKSYRGALRQAANWALRNVSLRERVRFYVDRKLYEPPGPRRVIANSEMVRRELLAHHPYLGHRVVLIRNGVDTDHFCPELRDIHRASVRGTLGIPEEALVGVFVGNNWRHKGLYTFIEALGILARKGVRGAYGIVVGKGNCARAAAFARRVGAGDTVRFVGPGAPDAYYGAGDLVVLPSYYDTFGIVVLEGMACGLPAVTSVFSGAHEVVTPGRNGFCVSDASDSAQLAGFVEHFMDKSALAAAGESARAAALEHTQERMYGRILEELEKVAAEKRQAG